MAAAADAPTHDAILKAAARGDLARVMALVRSGVDLNVRSEQGDTPLLVACKNGRWRVARYLAERKGVDLTATDVAGRSAADLAMQRGELPELVLLIECGSDAHQAALDSLRGHDAQYAARSVAVGYQRRFIREALDTTLGDFPRDLVALVIEYVFDAGLYR
jgi:ankyrin repeat protein